MELDNELHLYKIQLRKLEQELDNSYNLLGKKTLEFVEMQSEDINKLVDEVIRLKQKITYMESNKTY